MKNLLIFCFCSLYTLVSLAQNRITTDTAGVNRQQKVDTIF